MSKAFTHAAFVVASREAERVIAAWERILPEDDLPDTAVTFTPWQAVTLVTVYAANPEYITALKEIVAEELPQSDYALTCF